MGQGSKNHTTELPKLTTYFSKLVLENTWNFELKGKMPVHHTGKEMAPSHEITLAVFLSESVHEVSHKKGSKILHVSWPLSHQSKTQTLACGVFSRL